MAGAPLQSPFVVYIDTAESQPFTFGDIVGDAKDDDRSVSVRTEYRCLGRHPHSLGDYSGEGLVGHAHVERKSLEDAQSTVLGWESDGQRKKGMPGRRQRFEKELANLAAIPHGLVVVEASFADCLKRMPEWGVKPRATNAKIFARSVNAYLQDYKVPWLFCESRRLAEVATYRWLWRAWRKLEGAK